MRREERIAGALETGDLTGLQPAEERVVDDLRRALGSSVTWEPLPYDLGVRITEAVSGAQTRRRWAWPAAAVIALLLGVAAALVVFVGDNDTPQAVAVVAMAGTDLAPGASGSAKLIPSANGWAITLEVAGVPPAPEGAYYEGWVSDGEHSIAVGSFHMRGDEPTPIGLWSGVDLREFRTINITLQDVGAGGESSGRVVLTGTALPFD